jgi:hypothetical protein
LILRVASWQIVKEWGEELEKAEKNENEKQGGKRVQTRYPPSSFVAKSIKSAFHR